MASERRQVSVETEKVPADETQSLKKLTELYGQSIREGVRLNVDELAALARKKGWPVPSPGSLRQIKNNFVSTAQFTAPRKQRVFMSSTVPQAGHVQIDVGWMRPNLAIHNKGYRYILACVDAATLATEIIPMRNRKTESFRSAIEQLLESPYINTTIRSIISDRDVAISNESFDKQLMDKYGIRHVYFPIRSKAYASESAIRWFRVAAMNAARMAEAQKAPPAVRNSWVRIIPAYLRHVNSKLTNGSRKLRRMDVTDKNFPDLLRERHGSSDVSHYYASMTHTNVAPRIAERVFRYPLGMACLVKRTASTEVKDKAKGSWYKHSFHGAFGRTVYRIRRRALRSSATHVLIPVYQVDKGLSSIWLYEREIVPLAAGAVADSDDDGEEAEQEETEDEEGEEREAAPAAAAAAATAAKSDAAVASRTRSRAAAVATAAGPVSKQ